MKFNKLTKEEKKEGLTVEFVNLVDLKKKSSPVMFKEGDEPVRIMKCSSGYWVLTNDGYLKNDNGSLIVFSERDCQVARARYLFYHAEDEKREDAEKLLESRKKKIQEKLDVFKQNIEDIREYTVKGSTVSILASAIESVMSDEEKAAIKTENNRKIAMLPRMEEAYNHLITQFKDGHYNYLLGVLGIEEIGNPVSFKIDNSKDMRVLMNAFGAKAMEEAGYDVNMMYARMKVEQESVI